MLIKANLCFLFLTKGDSMQELTDGIIEKLLQHGTELSDLESLSRIMQACFEDEENLKNWDIETIFKLLKSKITESKNNFNSIEVKLKI